MAKANAKTGMSSDHIPSFAAIRGNAEQLRGRPLTAAEARDLRRQTLTMVYETQIHQIASWSFAGRNNPAQIAQDASNLLQAIKRYIDALKPALLNAGYTEKELNEAANKLEQPYQRTNSNTNSNK